MMFLLFASGVVATAATGCLPGATCPTDAISDAFDSLIQVPQQKPETNDVKIANLASKSLNEGVAESSSSSSSSSRKKYALMQDSSNAGDDPDALDAEELPTLEEAFREVQGTVGDLHRDHEQTLEKLNETTEKLQDRYRQLSDEAEEEKQRAIDEAMKKQAALARQVQKIREVAVINAKLREQDTSLARGLRKEVIMVRGLVRRLKLMEDGLQSALECTENGIKGAKMLVENATDPPLNTLLDTMQAMSPAPANPVDASGPSFVQLESPGVNAPAVVPPPNLDGVLSDIFTTSETADEAAMKALNDYIKGHIEFRATEADMLLKQADAALEKEGLLRRNLSQGRDQMYIGVQVFKERKKTVGEFCRGLHEHVQMLLSTSLPNGTSMLMLQLNAGSRRAAAEVDSPNSTEPSEYYLDQEAGNSVKDVTMMADDADADFDEAKAFYLQHLEEDQSLAAGVGKQVDQMDDIIGYQKVQEKKNQKNLVKAEETSKRMRDTFTTISEFLVKLRKKIEVTRTFLMAIFEDPDFVNGLVISNSILETTLNKPWTMPQFKRIPKNTSLSLLELAEPGPVADMISAIGALEGAEQTAAAKLDVAFKKNMTLNHKRLNKRIETSKALVGHLAEQNAQYNDNLIYHVELKATINALEAELKALERMADDIVKITAAN